MPRRYTNYDLTKKAGRDAEARVNAEFVNIDVNKQNLTHKLFSRFPLVGEVGEGEIVLCTVGPRIYTKIGGTLRYAALT